MKIDWPALGYAALSETVLIGLAVFSGPNGYLGMLPWFLQFPGALLVFFGPRIENPALLLVSVFLVQLAIWYGIISAWRAVRRRTNPPSPNSLDVPPKVPLGSDDFTLIFSTI